MGVTAAVLGLCSSIGGCGDKRNLYMTEGESEHQCRGYRNASSRQAYGMPSVKQGSHFKGQQRPTLTLT